MRFSSIGLIKAMMLTIVLLMGLEIFSSTIMPMIGMSGIRLSFNVLIILYLVMRVPITPIPFCIMLIQMLHSLFSVEGWALGTIAGIVILMLMNYLKDLIHFSSGITTMITIQLTQLVWFIIMGIMMSLKFGDFSGIFDMLIRFLPQSIILSFISPIMFNLLDFIWSSIKPGSSSDGLGGV
jgi:hypothetical protein